MPVQLYMSSPVHTVGPDDNLAHVQKRLDELRISSLAVVDANDKLMGVISRTDLIRIGRRQAGSRGKAALLTLPNKPVSRRMTPTAALPASAYGVSRTEPRASATVHPTR